MKKIVLLITALAGLHQASHAQFTAENIVALRVGDSTMAFANTGNTLALDQFTTSGTFVNTTLLPKTGTSAVALSGSATSEGQLSLSSNFTTLNLFAYKAAAPYASSLASSTSAAVNRVIVSVNAAGTVSFPTLTATGFSGNNPRGAVSNGTGYFGIGGNTGVAYGTPTANIDTIVCGTPSNIRSVNIFANQLFLCTGSGSVGIYRVGNGVPANSGNTATLYINTAIGSSPSPYSFAFNPDTTICYVSDDRTIANGGGIMKFTRTGSAWTLAYTLGTGTGSTVGSRSITVNWSGSNPVIYATTAESSLNRIIKITDTGSGAVGTTLVTAAANTIYRGIAFTPGTNPLPVSWMAFTGSRDKRGISLEWSTASEMNNMHFDIQRSSDNVAFEMIGRVKGAGNSITAQHYRFTDAASLAGTSYYRIMQVDLDGKTAYSNTISISGTLPAASIQAMPNPFHNELSIVISTAAEGTAIIELTDLLGKTHYATSQDVVAGDNQLSIPAERLNAGVYLIRIKTGNDTITQKVIRN